MFSQERIYAFDIETDTDGVNGLDPREARITEIAIATAKEDVVFSDADEAKLIQDFDQYVRSLPPGLLTGWNSVFFDNPFIWSRWHGVDGAGEPFVDARATHSAVTGCELGMHPILAPGLTPKYDFLPGYTSAINFVWSSSSWLRLDVHQHLDVSFTYKQVAADLGVKHRLKPVCKALGIPMFDANGKPYEDAANPSEVDRTKMHLLSAQDRHDYAVSDVRGTRQLAIRQLGAS